MPGKRGEVHGKAKIQEIDGQRVLKIDTGRRRSFYVLKAFKVDPKVAKLGIAMMSQDGNVYHVAVNGRRSTCDCPDHTYRPNGQCKHLKALRAVGYIEDDDNGREKPPPF